MSIGLVANTSAETPAVRLDRSSVFSSAGRFGRVGFMAWFFGFPVLVSAIAAGAAVFLLAGQRYVKLLEFVYPFVLVILVPLSFVFIIRRLHDLNKSGWISLFFLVPAVNLLLLLVLIFFPGTSGVNHHGAPRLARGYESVVVALGFSILAMGLVAWFGMPRLLDLVVSKP